MQEQRIDTVLGYDLRVMLDSTSTNGAYDKLVLPAVSTEVAEVNYPEENVESLSDWLSGKQVIR